MFIKLVDCGRGPGGQEDVCVQERITTEAEDNTFSLGQNYLQAPEEHTRRGGW